MPMPTRKARFTVRARIHAAIVVVLVFGLLSMLYIYRSLGQVAGHLAKLDEVDVPFSIAAIEMEKNAEEYSLGVLRYITRPRADIRREAENDRIDFARNHATYIRLGTSDRKRAIGRHLAKEHHRLVAIGSALMHKRDQVDRVFEHAVDQLEAIDETIDERMPPLLPRREPDRSARMAALANIEAEAAEIGFWLAALEHRPSALARQRLSEKLDELAEALERYRGLPLGPEEGRHGAAIQVLHRNTRQAVDQLLAGEDAINSLVGRFIKVQSHIDDVFDRDVESLALESLAEPRARADQAAGRVLATLRLAIPLYALVALLAGTLLVLTIVRPLRRLASGTEAIGAGDLGHRIPEQGRDEFEDLARQFNRMVAQLQDTTVSKAELQASEGRLRATVAELQQEIAERAQSERARAALQSELQRSEAMAAVGALVAGVAHEVRNPLFGISSTLDAMDANPGVQAVDDRYRSVLRREVDRLNRLMTHLLEYGRPSTDAFTTGGLGRILAEAIRVCTPGAEAAGVALVDVLDQGAATAMLRLDRDRLLQVFVNLIENALQHAPTGSEVTLAALPVRDTDGKAWIECRVEDHGPGFNAADLPFVFDPFFTRRRKGTGLGLSIVRRIVEEHGGRVVAGHREGGGAAMVVRLPVPETGQGGCLCVHWHGVGGSRRPSSGLARGSASCAPDVPCGGGGIHATTSIPVPTARRGLPERGSLVNAEAVALLRPLEGFGKGDHPGGALHAGRTEPRMTCPPPLPAQQVSPADPASARDAFDAAVALHRDELLHYLRKRLAGGEAAADLAQETLSRMLKYRDDPGIADHRLLMFRIANNLVLEYHRTRQRHQATRHVSLDDAGPLHVEQPSIEAIADARQAIQRLLKHTIAGLPPKCRLAFMLSRFDGLSYPQIAERMGVSVKMVEKHITKALLACRAAVGDREF